MAPEDPEQEEQAIDAMVELAIRTAAKFARRGPAVTAPEAATVLASVSGPVAGENMPEAKRTHAARPDLPEPAAGCQLDPQPELAAADDGTCGRAAAAPGRPRVDWPASLKEKYLGPAPRPGALPPRQVMAARLLLAGWRVSDVAAHLAVNRHTISAWLKDKQFQEEVRRMAMELPVPVPDFGADEELE